MNKHYDGQMLNSLEMTLGDKVKTYSEDPEMSYLIKVYGTKEAKKSEDKV